MITSITEEELEFMETFYYTPALVESLFNNFDNLADFNEEEFGEIRLGQIPLLSFEYMIGIDPKLNDRQNFQLREGAGTLYCFGGRNFGKSLVVETLDLVASMVCLENEHVGFSSLDALHIRGILEKVIVGLRNHPFLKLYKANIKRSPNYNIFLRNGYLLDSINMNLQSPKPGAGFFQKHFKRLYLEEASFETEEVYKKRQDSVDEDGCVIRSSGMTNFTKYSPAGKVFYSLSKAPWVVNLPQYINPKFDDSKNEQAKKEHGGEGSLTFRVFVKGEVIEEGISVFDMTRVKRNYNENKRIKFFEIKKENFASFKDLLIVEPVKQASVSYMCADIGETAPTEIVIFFKVNETYKYTYNITLYGLTDKEQYKVFYWLIKKLGITYTGLDTTDGTGRAIFRSLAESFPKENLCWCGFNEKIRVGFEKDDDGNVVFENGLPKHREEHVNNWAVKRLKDLLYEEGKIEIPLDYKFDREFNSVIAVQSGNRVIYQCVTQSGDHLFSAWKVFAIAEWNNEFSNANPIRTKKFCKSGI